MSNFINKHFKKGRCVKVIYFGEGKKQEVHYLIPRANTVRIKSLEKAFVINDKDFFIDTKGFITYVFSYDRVEPVNPNNAKRLGTIDPADLNTAIDSRVASEILSATRQRADINVILFILIGVLVLGFLAIWYTTNERFDDLFEKLKPLLEVLN